MAANIQNYFIKVIKNGKAKECDDDNYRELIKKAVEYGRLQHAARLASISEFLKKSIVEKKPAKKVRLKICTINLK